MAVGTATPLSEQSCLSKPQHSWLDAKEGELKGAAPGFLGEEHAGRVAGCAARHQHLGVTFGDSAAGAGLAEHLTLGICNLRGTGWPYDLRNPTAADFL